MGLERARKNRLEAFATYDLGVAKLGIGYDGKNVGTSDTVYAANLANEYASIRTPGTADYVRFNEAAAWSVGVSAPIGAFTVGANYAKRDIAKLTEVVAKYDLSKRTSLNASLAVKRPMKALTAVTSTVSVCTTRSNLTLTQVS